MGDAMLVLLVILAVVLIVRGPKTLPKIGQALGRGVKEARREAESANADKPAAPETTDRP